jgi:hypothetical protein
MTERQSLVARVAVALLLAQVRRNEEISLGVLFDACELAGVEPSTNPLHGLTDAELLDVIKVTGAGGQ